MLSGYTKMPLLHGNDLRPMHRQSVVRAYLPRPDDCLAGLRRAAVCDEEGPAILRWAGPAFGSLSPFGASAARFGGFSLLAMMAPIAVEIATLTPSAYCLTAITIVTPPAEVLSACAVDVLPALNGRACRASGQCARAYVQSSFSPRTSVPHLSASAR